MKEEKSESMENLKKKLMTAIDKGDVEEIGAISQLIMLIIAIKSLFK